MAVTTGNQSLYIHSLQRDESTKLPRLTFAQFKGLVIKPDRELKGESLHRVTINGAYPKITENGMIPISEYDAVASTLQLPMTGSYAKITQLAKTSTFEFLEDSSLLAKFFDRQLVSGEHILTNTRTNFGAMLSYFLVYENFAPVYEAYMMDPDTGVQVADRTALHFEMKAASRGKPTEEDLRITCHILFLLMGKGFNTAPDVKKNQVTAFLASRKNAANFSVGCPMSDPLLVEEDLDVIHTCWSILPKLRERIFFWFQQMMIKYPEMGSAITLLNYSSMATIKAITEFIDSSIKSKVHSEKVILGEIADFLERCNRMKEEMGHFWPFYRVLKSGDSTLVTTNFPNLSRAAVIFKKTFLDTSASYKNMVVPKAVTTIPDLDAKAAQQETRAIFKKAETSGIGLSEREKSAAIKIGLDIEKWNSNKKTMDAIDAQGFSIDSPEQFAQLFEAMKMVRKG